MLRERFYHEHNNNNNKKCRENFKLLDLFKTKIYRIYSPLETLIQIEYPHISNQFFFITVRIVKLIKKNVFILFDH